MIRIGSRHALRLLVTALLSLIALSAMAESVDVLITGGRVIDPETGHDAIASVLVDDGRVLAVVDDPTGVEAARVIDASGLVVAPGFVDLHVHGQSDDAHEYQARDGVTTALELEWGYPEVASFLTSREGRSRIHYGAAASHGALRALARIDDEEARAELRMQLAEAVREEEPLRNVQALTIDSFREPITREQEAWLAGELRAQVEDGAIGIGMAHAYYPGAGAPEIYRLFGTAAGLGVPIYTHVRGRGLPAVQEVLANAAASGAALHIVHLNSVSLGQIEETLALIHDAQARGVDVTTEAYPYTAGSTSIQSALFDGDWRNDYGGIDYGDIQWQDTGERLTAETFAKYRAQGGTIILHMMKPEWIDAAIGNDWVMVASDGMPYAPGAHPRTAGTFSRVLGRYVRERGVLDLPTAIRKMTLLPALRLEPVAPQMANKGRLRAGADADIVIFDPDSVIDTATFESGPRFSKGIEWVLVNGVPVVAEGESVPDVYPGQPIRGRRGRAVPPP